MKCAVFRFYAELNDFLSPEHRQVGFEHFFWGQPSVKDRIESLGVPHTEVDLILVNGESVDFSRRVRDGDRISVYPVFESIDISPVLQVRPEPLREVRFVLDTHLGKLASYLRMMGFDALYDNTFSDKTLAGISVRERRILLTRDRGLLKRDEITHGYCVRENEPRLQLAEILHRFDLFEAVKPFSRCMECNTFLRPVSREDVQQRLPPRVFEQYKEFCLCPGCGRVYWEGSHRKEMQGLIEQVRVEQERG